MRTALFACLLLLTQGAAAATAQDPHTESPSGEFLFIARGCLGCHGASGEGGVGPTLVQTPLAFDAFLDQVRDPRSIMPEFPRDVVTDSELQTIYAYVRDLAPVPAPLRADVPVGEQDPASCATCHMDLNPTIVRQFHGSAMGTAGVQNPRVDWPQKQMTCADCHGLDHTVITASKGRVPETSCAGCHPLI